MNEFVNELFIKTLVLILELGLLLILNSFKREDPWLNTLFLEFELFSKCDGFNVLLTLLIGGIIDEVDELVLLNSELDMAFPDGDIGSWFCMVLKDGSCWF